MWGEGGKLYWDCSIHHKIGDCQKKNKGEEKKGGIVVIFGWSSSSEVQLNNFTLLYSSLGWNSLICSPHFLNLFFPEKAASLAFLVLKELIKVLRLKTCPVIFASFSGGSKACMYKVLQMLDGTLEAHLNQDDIRLVRRCISGFVFDSGPTDCTGDVGARFVLRPVINKSPGAEKLLSWIAKWFTYGSDALFLTKFESQNNEYWKTLYSSISLGAPVLFLCSEGDDLAPCRVIWNFARHLEDLGADVELVKWKGSPHLGHYEHYAAEYQAAVALLLDKAVSIFSSKIQRRILPNTTVEEIDDEIPELICHLQKAAVSSKWNLGSLDLSQSDPSSNPRPPGRDDYTSSWDSTNLEDDQKERSINVPSTSTSTSSPCINAHSMLGQVLFDACVPKNVEGWDVRFSGSLNGQPLASARQRSPLKSFRCIRRSRL